MKIGKNSMLYWFPKVTGLGVPIPRTELVRLPDDLAGFKYLNWIEHECPDSVIDGLVQAAGKIGYPIFWRTDEFSNKHSGDGDEWFPLITKPSEFRKKIGLLADDCGCHDLPICGFAVREFLELDWKFKAFYGMPVAPERRYFVRDGEVLCRHSYWPEKAMRFWGKQTAPDGWKDELAEMNEEGPSEVRLLSSYASKLGGAIGGEWSIDFARAREGTWYFIDAALAKDSWHPECKGNGPVGEPKQFDESAADDIFKELGVI